MLKEKNDKSCLIACIKKYTNTKCASRVSRHDLQCIAKTESQLKYENISHSQRIDIYYNFISKKITNYIHDDLKNPTQCIGSTEVLDDKRDMRIEEYARYSYARMPVNQKIAICNKLDLNI